MEKAEMNKLAVAAREGDEEAFNSLIGALSPLVRHIAWKYAAPWYMIPGTSVTGDDLYSAGIEGIINSLSRYDQARGDFLFCVSLWIESKMRKTIQKGRLVKGYRTVATVPFLEHVEPGECELLKRYLDADDEGFLRKAIDELEPIEREILERTSRYSSRVEASREVSAILGFSRSYYYLKLKTAKEKILAALAA